MINKFAAPCANCGRTVRAGNGITNLVAKGQWKTEHNSSLACKEEAERFRPSAGAMLGYRGGFGPEWSAADLADVFNPNEGCK